MNMKKTVFRFVSLILGAAMLITPASASKSTDTSTKEDTQVNTQTASDKPIILDFSDFYSFVEKGNFFNGNGNVEGERKFVTLEDGTGCMQLIYSPHSDASLSEYRIMFGFKDPKTVTEKHKYMRITYMTTDSVAATLSIYDNAAKYTKILDHNTAQNAGKWCRTEVVDLSANAFLKRYMDGKHNTIQFSSADENSVIYLRELALFTSREEAYSYYGETVPVDDGYTAMTFGNAGNYAILSGDNYGVNSVSHDAVNITYAESTNMGVHYMAKLKFKSKNTVPDTDRFVRVLYSANIKGDGDVSMRIINDGASKSPEENIEIVKNVTDTNGAYVLSDTVELTQNMMERFAGTGTRQSNLHCSFVFTDDGTDSAYSIKSVYFFSTKEGADAFDLRTTYRTLTIGGTDISKYSIVVSDELSDASMNALLNMRTYINTVWGVNIPVVSDRSPESEYEILVGVSERELSKKPLEGHDLAGEAYRRYAVSLIGNKLIITAANSFGVRSAVEAFMDGFLHRTESVIPTETNIDHTCKIVGLSTYQGPKAPRELPDNVDVPEVFTEDFESDKGYFAEEANGSDWTYANGVYSADAEHRALSYIHVYETNVDLTVKLMYTKAGGDGDMGVMLRYVAEDAYLKAGYDFYRGEWYIEYREGNDFYPFRIASAKAELEKDKWYTVRFVADGKNATLSIDGKQLLTASDAIHVTPGRIAVFAEDAAVSFDDLSAVLLSGEGTIMKDVIHTRLFEDSTGNGASFFELSDGTVHAHVPQYKIGVASSDGGKTWYETDIAMGPKDGYANIHKLSDGSFIGIFKATVNGKSCMISRITTDEGKTWQDRGIICDGYYKGSEAVAGNMNDKITVSPTTGRIFYAQNYQAPNGKPVDGRTVFCEFYYSDDKGATWHKSETDSWEIEGNEETQFFGECKILECADGTLRMYCSWSDFGCIVYSESYDNGVTWGKLCRMEGYITPRSSMQFCHDPYGETDTTYYMIWIYNDIHPTNKTMPRKRLSLAKTTDGKNWVYLGDVWRWEAAYYHHASASDLNQIVNPTIGVCRDSLIIASGISEKLLPDGSYNYHGLQAQHIWTIDRDGLTGGKVINRFTDLSVGAHYYDAVTYVTDAGLYNGVSENEFAPDAVMNRAMFVTVLGRLSGVDTNKYTKPTFDDVKEGQWYTAYVEWAASEGIVNGIGGGLFGVTGDITAEQACTILYRYCGGKAAKNTGLTVSTFADGASVSGYAVEGMQWALANGIYGGQNGLLKPTAPASRAVVAEMFYNYVTVFGK